MKGLSVCEDRPRERGWDGLHGRNTSDAPHVILPANNRLHQFRPPQLWRRVNQKNCQNANTKNQYGPRKLVLNEPRKRICRFLGDIESDPSQRTLARPGR